jgi:N-acetylmuramoyl-L-alanine amidase
MDVTVLPDSQVVVAEPQPVALPTVPLASIPVNAAPVTVVHPPPPAKAHPAVAANHFTETWVSLERWSRHYGFGRPKRISEDAFPVFTVDTTNGVMSVKTGSQLAYWDGLEYHLGFAPQIINGQPYVHTLDIQKNFEPLVSRPMDSTKSNIVLVIDPGHGGMDTGTKSVLNGHYEKEYALDWARRLQALLITNGWTVALTRSNDTMVTLSNRVAFAEHRKADLFLSLHFNSSSPDREPAGLETYCLTPAGMPSNLTRGFADEAAHVFPNNAFDAQNLQYALRLHRALLKVNGNLDRGICRARFLTVLQGQNRPAVLVEGGYLSNPNEAREIADPNYRQKLAEAVANALLETWGTNANLAGHSAPASAAAGSDGKVN